MFELAKSMFEENACGSVRTKSHVALLFVMLPKFPSTAKLFCLTSCCQISLFNKLPNYKIAKDLTLHSCLSSTRKSHFTLYGKQSEIPQCTFNWQSTGNFCLWQSAKKSHVELLFDNQAKFHIALLVGNHRKFPCPTIIRNFPFDNRRNFFDQ
jgi:hypothetical protein